MRAILLLVLFTLALVAGCRRESGADLVDTAWRLVELEPAGPEEIPTWPPLSLSFAAGSLGGNTGCNGYGAAYEVMNDRLQVEQVEMTAAECTTPGLTARENGFLSGLDEAGVFTVDETSLTIETDQGRMRFVPLEVRTASVDGVYQALLREWDDGSERFYVAALTIFGPPPGDLAAALDTIEATFPAEAGPGPELVADYALKNRDARLLDPTDAPVTFLGGEIWQESLSAGATWDTVASSAPPEATAIFAFSDVAFNEMGNEALVYLQRIAPGDTGGFYHWLRLDNDVWTTVRGERVWSGD